LTTLVGLDTLAAMSEKTYTVKHIPEPTWRKLRLRAIRDRVTVKDLFRRWIQQYAEGK